MHLLPPKCGFWSHKTGWSLKSGQRYKETYQCIQIVVLHESWSLNLVVSDDRFCCMWIHALNKFDQINETSRISENGPREPIDPVCDNVHFHIMWIKP